MGYKAHIFTPEWDSPAADVVSEVTVAQYNDKKALTDFASKVDVITFEFENVPHARCLELLESKKPVAPSSNILRICRNRLREKTFINKQGIATTEFYPVSNLADLKAAAMTVRIPAILKTTELGYDGKGQVTLRTGTDLRSALDSLKTSEAIFEAFVEFKMEISVIVARSSRAGETKCFVPVQNIHKNHILDETIAPAPIDKALAAKAEAIAVKLAKSLDLVGLLAVEMFVGPENELLVNELAPRPHNSGHWTLDACVTSQFEQQIRAVCGLPLGNPNRMCDARMKNLIGDDVKDVKQFLQDPDAKLHLYGKKEARPGRKMGHVTTLKAN